MELHHNPNGVQILSWDGDRIESRGGERMHFWGGQMVFETQCGWESVSYESKAGADKDGASGVRWLVEGFCLTVFRNRN